MPFGPSSFASDFMYPTTPGRTAFVSARWGDGSRTASELIRTIRPWSLFEQVRQREPDEPHDRQQQQLDRFLHLLARRSRRPSRRAGPPLFGTRMSMPPNGLDRRVDRALEVVRLADVADDGDAADALGLALEHVAAAGEHDDVGALPRPAPRRSRGRAPRKRRRRSPSGR